MLVRPFDLRAVFYAHYFLARSRRTISAHLESPRSMALLAPRQAIGEPGALVSRWAAGHKVLSPYDVCSVFPLWLRTKDGEQKPNLSPRFLERLSSVLGESPPAEDVLAYVYGVLYSPTYRDHFRAALRREFARIPMPRGAATWRAVGSLGQRLIRLHLLREATDGTNSIRLVGDLATPVERATYCANEQRVQLHEELSLEGIEPAFWAYRIGGHQVLARWLGARRRRVLRNGEARVLRQVAGVLRQTLATERELEAWGSDILSF